MIKPFKETRNEDGKLHSFNDEPAILWDNGDKDWYQNGKKHRDNGPAGESTECKAWYQNGVPHRLDGPAVINVDGYKAWYQYGKLHRLDGPAVEWSDGHKEYWIEGKKLSEEEFLERTAMAKETLNEVGQLHSFNDEPSIVDPDEYKAWYQNGERHRVDGPAYEGAEGDKHWYQNGEIHRVDGPAVEHTDGYKAWYQNGLEHRVDGPAVEYPNGEKEYWIEGQELTEEEFLARTEAKGGMMKKETRNENGELHSFNDQPAVEYADGYKAWYQNGLEHRVGDPAFEFSDGSKHWFQNGHPHRVDGPAIEYSDGTKFWYQNGKKHRLDGPAIERPNGTKEYWIEGEELSEEEFLAKTAKPSKLKLFKEIYNVYDAGEKWVSQIPNEINEAFFDNPFVEAQTKISELLIKHVFTEDERVAVEWSLHEWYHNRELSIRLNGEEFEFLCLEDYLSYLQTHEGWK